MRSGHLAARIALGQQQRGGSLLIGADGAAQ